MPARQAPLKQRTYSCYIYPVEYSCGPEPEVDSSYSHRPRLCHSGTAAPRTVTLSNDSSGRRATRLLMTRNIPGTSRKPLAPPLAMSTAPPDATPSPLPASLPDRSASASRADNAAEGASTKTVASPHPRLRIQVEDLVHEGAVRFFQHAKPGNLLTDAITTVMRELYLGSLPPPPVRSVTLFLHKFDGVAYTKGSDLDNDHKELHMSLDYIAGIEASSPSRIGDEIRGVIVHEMVHVWQWNGKGTCPGGLIEGIADFVRLRAKLAPPHWTRAKGGKWDAGYERTAYFLDWLEKKFGLGGVLAINDALRDAKYDEAKFWRNTFRRPVHELWNEYQSSFDKD